MAVPKADKEQLICLLVRLKRLAAAHKLAHHNAARSSARANKWMRISSIILSLTVAGSLFSSLENVLGSSAKILIALLSLAAASLTFVQLFLRSAERSDSHKTFASKFSSFEREVDVALANPPRSVSDMRDEVETLGDQLTTIASYAPFVEVEFEELVLSRTR